MSRYTVIYVNISLPFPVWQFFLCFANDAEHAEELCMNANPDTEILWVNEGENFTME